MCQLKWLYCYRATLTRSRESQIGKDPSVEDEEIFLFFFFPFFKINSKERMFVNGGFESFDQNFCRRFITIKMNRKTKRMKVLQFLLRDRITLLFSTFRSAKGKRIRTAAKKNLFAKSFPLSPFYSLQPQRLFFALSRILSLIFPRDRLHFSSAC